MILTCCKPGCVASSRTAPLTCLALALATTIASTASAQGEVIEVDAGEEPVAEVDAGGDQIDAVEVDANGEPPPSPNQGDGAPEPAEPAAGPPQQVTVMGVRADRLAGSTQVLGEKQLERNEYDDPHRVLLQVPGVYVRGEDGFGLRPNIGIRGASSDRSKKITLMEDGVLLAPAPYSAPAAYYFPIVTRMVAVRVIKGPAGIVYGPQTIGGALDLRTRSIPAATSGAVDLGVGQYGYGKLHAYAGSSDEHTGFLVEGVHVRNDGFKTLDGGGDTGFYRNEWMVKANHVVDPYADVQHDFTVKLGFSNETSHETYLGLTDSDFRNDPFRRYRASANDRMQWHRTQIVLSHRAQLDLHHSLVTTAYRHDLTRSWNRLKRFRNGPSLTEVLSSPDSGTRRIFYEVLRGADAGSEGETLMIGPNGRKFVSQGVQTVHRARASTGPLVHQIEHGVRLHNDRIERLHQEDGFVMTGGELVPDGLPTITTDDNRAETAALALHASDAVTWGRVTLTPGARVEVIRWTFDDRLADAKSGDSYAVFLPGVGAFVAITDELGALGGVYRGFSPVAPGPAPSGADPELSVNYEAGLRYAAKATRADVVGFLNDYSNLTDVCTFSNGCLDANLDRQFDAGRARTYGVEAHAQHEIRTGFGLVVPLLGAYTFTRAEFRENFESANPQFGTVRVGDELPYVPRHQASFTIGAETRRFGVAATGTYVDKMREQAGSGPFDPATTTDAFFTLDVGAHVNLTERAQIYGNVRNVLNDEYIAARRPFGARPGIKRWGHLGARYKF